MYAKIKTAQPREENELHLRPFPAYWYLKLEMLETASETLELIMVTSSSAILLQKLSEPCCQAWSKLEPTNKEMLMSVLGDKPDPWCMEDLGLKTAFTNDCTTLSSSTIRIKCNLDDHLYITWTVSEKERCVCVCVCACVYVRACVCVCGCVCSFTMERDIQSR